MSHQKYTLLKQHIFSIQPSSAIAELPVFNELAKSTPSEIAWLCIGSQIMPRSDLLALIRMDKALLQSIILWLVQDIKNIAECNRDVLRYLIGKSSKSFLQAQHNKLRGLTIGYWFLHTRTWWALDILGTSGINPYYDKDGTCLLSEKVFPLGSNIIKACQHAVKNNYVIPQSEDVLHHFIYAHCQEEKQFDLLTALHGFFAIGIIPHNATSASTFSLLSRSPLRRKNPLAFILALQYISKKYPSVLQLTHQGLGVLEQSPTVEMALLTYAHNDSVWQSSHVQEYIETNHRALLHALEKHYYPDLVSLVSGHEDMEKPTLAQKVLEVADVNIRTAAEGVNDWMGVYAARLEHLELYPAAKALFHYALLEFQRAAEWTKVPESLWHVFFMEHEQKNHLWDNAISVAYEECRSLIKEMTLCKSLGYESTYRHVALYVETRMKPFLQGRPAVLSGTVFMRVFSEFLTKYPELLRHTARRLQSQLLNIPVIAETSKVETKEVLPPSGGAISGDNTEPIAVRLYTEDALSRYKVYVDEQPKREQNIAFHKRLVSDKLHAKTLARSNGALPHLNALRSTFLHFKDVIDHIENHLYLCDSGSGAFYVPPVLIVGGPGIGKTFFLHELARAIKTTFEMIGLESVTAGFEITGLSEGYASGAPGKLLNCLITSPTLNPIVLLDEIDKAGGDSRYAVVNRLLPLLERYTAQKYKDECLPIEIDASHIVWFATANDETKLSGPIKSRFDTFYLPNPNAEQKNALTQGVYSRIIESNLWGKHLDKTLSDNVLSALSRASTPGAARDIRRILTTACARALREKTPCILISHLGLSSTPIMPWDEEPRALLQQKRSIV